MLGGISRLAHRKECVCVWGGGGGMHIFSFRGGLRWRGVLWLNKESD